jgi:hypothetical protein
MSQRLPLSVSEDMVIAAIVGAVVVFDLVACWIFLAK